MKVKVKSLSHVQLLATPWTAAHQAPLSMGFSRQEVWDFSKGPEKDHRNVFPWLVFARFTKVRQFNCNHIRLLSLILISSYPCFTQQKNCFRHFVIGDILSVSLIGYICGSQSLLSVFSYCYQLYCGGNVFCGAWLLEYLSNEEVKDCNL